MLLASGVQIAPADSPDQWVALGVRVHGGFGSYIALGIRIGRDAMRRLHAPPRELQITYQSGPAAACPCVVDGIMLATVSTPGQGLLRVLPKSADPRVFGVATIADPKSGHVLRYTMPTAVGPLLDDWNRGTSGLERYNLVIGAASDRLYRVQVLESSMK